MSDKPVLPAPPGWDAYARGDHLRMPRPDASGDEAKDRVAVSEFVANDARTSGSELVTWLRLVDAVPEKLAKHSLQSADGAASSDGIPHWRAVENAALLPKEGNQSKWRVRYNALTRLAAQAPDDPGNPAASNLDWQARVAIGRLHMHLGDCALRDLGAVGYTKAEAHLRTADAWFTGLEGEPDLKAVVDIVRGRGQAWRAGARGATAVLSIALVRFREMGNLLREADAAYELGIANLDSNYPEAADKLFSVSVEANRARHQQPEALARALQSRARSRIDHARQLPASAQEQVLQLAGQDAREAFELSEPNPGDRGVLHELGRLDVSSNELGPRPHDAFRATMAARDLAAIELVRLGSSSADTERGLERARVWYRIACKEQGLGHVFDDGDRGGLRQQLDTASHAEQFTLLRLVQLELDILRRTAPRESVELLVGVGKKFLARNEVNYAIECFESAAAGYGAKSDGADESSRRAAAEYWRYRAARLASMVGLRHNGAALPAMESPEVQKALEATVERLEATVLQVISQGPDRVSVEVVTAGRQAVTVLHVFGPDIAGVIDFGMLNQLSDRGDIPRIIEQDKVDKNYAYILEEQVSGPRLRDILQTKSFPALTRIRLAARLCRTVATLLYIHAPKSHLKEPLFITPDDVQLLPGGRCVIARFGPVHGLRQPSPGWAFLYEGLKDGSDWPARADAVAVARVIRLLLGENKIDIERLWARSYLRRAFGMTGRALDQVSPETVEALGRLLRLKAPAKNVAPPDASETPDRSPPKQGYRDLMNLAFLLDKSAVEVEQKASR